MDLQALPQRIAQGEDLHTEFKAGPLRVEDLAAMLVAFANTDGGQLILGVTQGGVYRTIQLVKRATGQVPAIYVEGNELIIALPRQAPLSPPPAARPTS